MSSSSGSARSRSAVASRSVSSTSRCSRDRLTSPARKSNSAARIRRRASARLVRFGGEQHRLRGELGGRGVGGPGVRGRGGRVQRFGDRAVRSRIPRPGPRSARAFRVGRDAGQPPVELCAAHRRQRLHRRGADQRMRGRQPVPGLDHHAGQHGRVHRRGGIRELIKYRQSLRYADPARRPDHGQRGRGVGVQRAGQAFGQRAGQRRHLALGAFQAGRDLDGPERVAAGLPGHLAGLRGGHRPRQQVLDLPHVQRRQVDHLGRGQGGQQLVPAARRRGRAGGERIRGGLRAGGHQQRQRPARDPPQREGQSLQAGLVKPVDVIDRDQQRALGHEAAQCGQHRETDRVRGGWLIARGSQQQRDLQCFPLRIRDPRRHRGQHVGEQVRQSGERQIGFAGRGLAAQHAIPAATAVSIPARHSVDLPAPASPWTASAAGETGIPWANARTLRHSAKRTRSPPTAATSISHHNRRLYPITTGAA